MSSPIAATPPRQAAVVAGLAYVIITVLALFANFFVLERLTAPDDAATTVSNIANSEVLFRSGVVAFIIVLIADVVVAWGLYVFLQRTNRELSLFAAWFRLIYVAITAAALLNLLIAVKLVDETGYTTSFDAGQRNAQVMLFLDAYTYGWSIGLVLFGVHLLLLGLLILKSDDVPSILGILVALAGVGYMVGKIASVLLPDYNDAFLVFIAVLAVPGELGLTAWLLWKGGKGLPTSDQQGERVHTGSAA
jgi:Domain of unknown function (DUF4386)